MLIKVHGLVWFVVCLYVCLGFCHVTTLLSFVLKAFHFLFVDSEAIHDVIIPNCSFTTECSAFKELRLNCSFTAECSAFKELHLNCSFTTECSAFKELHLNCSFTTEFSAFKELRLNCSFTTKCSAFKELHLNFFSFFFNN